MSKNDEKLPYLHRKPKRRFLVSGKNMGLCLYTISFGPVQNCNIELVGSCYKGGDFLIKFRKKFIDKQLTNFKVGPFTNPVG